MANNLHQLKSRLKSITSTQKITKAMRLVAISKLQTYKTAYLKNSAYSKALADLLKQVLANANTLDHPLTKIKNDTHPFTIVFTSDMGMAGGYNQDIFKEVERCHQENMLYLWIGLKGYDKYKALGYKIINEKESSDAITYEKCQFLASKVLEDYQQNKITSIHLIYSVYVNATTFSAVSEKLLPVAVDHNLKSQSEMIFDPSADAILDDLVKRVLLSELYRIHIEAKTSEYSARRVAMENASDNAQEIIDKCQLEYNKIRQAAITQEITEIISSTLGG